MAVVTSGNEDSSHLEFHYNPSHGMFRVYTRSEAHDYTFMDFRNHQELDGWLNIIVSYKNVGLLQGMLKPDVTVYINGIQCESLHEKSKALSKFEIPVDKKVDICVGKSYIGHFHEVTPFVLGPFLVFDENLMRQQC